MKAGKPVRSLAATILSLSIAGCPFIDMEGRIEVVNDTSGEPLSLVYFDTDCSDGWSGKREVDIAYEESRTFTVKSANYDVRICKKFQETYLCTIWYDEWLGWNDKLKVKDSFGEEYSSSLESECRK